MVVETLFALTVVPDTVVAKRFPPVALVKLKFWVFKFVLDAVVAKEFTEVTLVNDPFCPLIVVPDTVVAKSEVPVALTKLIFVAEAFVTERLVPVALLKVTPAKAERFVTFKLLAAMLPDAVIFVLETFVINPDAPWR